MAIAVETTAGNVKPVNGKAQVFRFIAGTGGTVAGKIVCMGADGVRLCDGSDDPNGIPVGIALQTALITESVDVVTHGAVNCVTGATAGSVVYPKDGTPGAPYESASTKKYRVGFAVNATTVFVTPGYLE